MKLKRLFEILAVAATAILVSVAVGIGGDPPGAAGAQAAGEGKQKVRYKGKSRSGQPIRFTVVERQGRARITKLSVDVVAECWADADFDGNADKIVAHISGLDGKVSRDGLVEVYYAPDDDTEYLVDGVLGGKGEAARLNVVVGGYFSADGVPNGGALECDNWGAIYKAKPRRG